MFGIKSLACIDTRVLKYARIPLRSIAVCSNTSRKPAATFLEGPTDNSDNKNHNNRGRKTANNNTHSWWSWQTRHNSNDVRGKVVLYVCSNKQWFFFEIQITFNTIQITLVQINSVFNYFSK